MATHDETGVGRQASPLFTPRVSAGFHALRTILRFARRRLDAWFSLSGFDEQLIYGLGIDPLPLAGSQHRHRTEALLRLVRMRRCSTASRGRWLTLLRFLRGVLSL
ncbi:hypothetical protein GCM10010862_42520 [Devosia nitrariae]|uniref:DUF1127 domain-containing protein n=1 Tax=Devosia nitrariae TaxID=2071872 RepID=A0ABQ5WB86_9HYPH|nr:hypothetical protein GCM10010862_42520 [Devosia nitrariae]